MHLGTLRSLLLVCILFFCLFVFWFWFWRCLLLVACCFLFLAHLAGRASCEWDAEIHHTGGRAAAFDLLQSSGLVSPCDDNTLKHHQQIPIIFCPTSAQQYRCVVCVVCCVLCVWLPDTRLIPSACIRIGPLLDSALLVVTPQYGEVRNDARETETETERERERQRERKRQREGGGVYTLSHPHPLTRAISVFCPWWALPVQPLSISISGSGGQDQAASEALAI